MDGGRRRFVGRLLQGEGAICESGAERERGAQEASSEVSTMQDWHRTGIAPEQNYRSTEADARGRTVLWSTTLY